MIPRKPIARSTRPIPRRRAKARTWKCAHCQARSTGTVCASCKIRRKTKRTTLKARCDALARALCKRLAGGKCARCGGVGTDWAHRFPRRHHALRWSMSNCDLLCRPCHQFFSDHPATFHEWLAVRIGTTPMLELEAQANAPWDKSYEKVLKYLTSFG